MAGWSRRRLEPEGSAVRPSDAPHLPSYNPTTLICADQQGYGKDVENTAERQGLLFCHGNEFTRENIGEARSRGGRYLQLILSPGLLEWQLRLAPHEGASESRQHCQHASIAGRIPAQKG